MTAKTLLALAAACAALTGLATSAHAQASPLGVWIDHTGRGGVEITECGANLCGRVVWLKDNKNKQACGTQIIGNVKPVSAGLWDKGWIFDPEEDRRYDVELKTIGSDKLRVVGYMGTKFLSETMTWTRAPADIQRCGGGPARQAAVPAPVAPVAPRGDAAAESAPVARAPAPVETTRPAPVETSPAPAPYEQADSSDEPAPKRGKDGKRRTAQKECRLDLPYIKVTYPCID